MFSGAVRAVFRKKKGFGFVKILHWLLLVLFSAAAALARLRLLAVGFDADGLPVPMDLNTMVLPAVLVVAAVIAVIMARRYPAQRELCGSMDLYFAFDRYGDDFRPKQKKAEPCPEGHSSTNSLVVEARRIELRSILPRP